MQLVINAGSSSLKWALYRFLSSSQPVVEGVFERLNSDDCVLIVDDHSQKVGLCDIAKALELLSKEVLVPSLGSSEITSCVHRVVHGADKYSRPVLVSDQVIADIKEFSVLAPLHNPANLSGILACKKFFSSAKQVAIFDTAFHQSIREEIFLYGIPYELYEKHRIRKYGFHGISHSFITSLLRSRFGRDVDAIIAHLGSGSSITAVSEGRSVDTTMGFTPLDGVLMSTRSGELDPEIPLFLLRNGHYSVDELEELLSKKSGLLGITGHSDMRDIWAAARSGSERDQLALEMLSYRVAYYINALKTAVHEPEVLVFTAGMGEQAWYVRKRVCEHLGVSIDEQANKDNEEIISSEDAKTLVCVLETDEQLHMHHLSASVLQDK